MKHSYAQRVIVLGLLSAVGPFAIDMYLPALPALGKSLHADPAAVQGSLMAFIASFGACQLLYGPLSDMFGRKRPLFIGIGLFVVASIACALADNIYTLIAWRVVQGIGACASSVIPRAIVRDLHTGYEAARLMSSLMLVFSVCPLLAPLAGSLAVAWSTWRAVFWSVAVLGGLGLVLTATRLEETRPADRCVNSNWSSALSAYRTLLSDPRYIGLSFIGGFGMAGFYVYLGNSSFVLIQHYGLSPTLYGLSFSLNAAAFIGTAQFTSKLTRRFGLEGVIRLASLGYAAVMLSLCFIWASGVDSLLLLTVLLFVGYGFLGLVMPTTSVLAVEEHGEIAGTANAFMGTVHLLTGAVIVSCVAALGDHSSWSMIVGVAISACIAAACALWTLVFYAPAQAEEEAEEHPQSTGHLNASSTVPALQK